MKKWIFLVWLFIAFRPALTQAQGENMLKIEGDEDVRGTDSTDPFVPEWARSVIWYQIFPDRFRNGDPSNDPVVESLRGADPQEMPANWEIHPWGSDWYQLQDYEKQNGEKELWKHLTRRRYGGDLQGIIDKLDYLQQLGVTGIYLNPIFEAPSHHKYDGATYHHVDPHFGPDPAGDKALIAKEDPLDSKTWVWTQADELALELIDQCHRRGMRILFDGVFNHVGINHFAFQDLKKHQQKSSFKEWFKVLSWEDKEEGTAFSYKGWWDVASLPEWQEDENGIVEGPRAYIFEAVKRWMNPKGRGIAHGIDGWRLDVAHEIAHPFWKRFRRHIRRINPEALLVGEINGNPNDLLPFVQGDELDTEMNYNFAFASFAFFVSPNPHRLSATQFDQKLQELRESYPEGVAACAQNLLGSHDINRISSAILNRQLGNFGDWNEWPDLSRAVRNPDYRVYKPSIEDYELMKLLVFFQMTYYGAPMIYYGDEQGMWGDNDPGCRKPMFWEDIDYDPERYLPDGKKRKPDPVKGDAAMFEYYKKMIGIRKAYPALQTGSFQTILTDDMKDLFVFSRSLGKEVLLVVINNAPHRQEIKIPMPKYRNTWENILNEQELQPQKGFITLTLDGKTGTLLRQK